MPGWEPLLSGMPVTESCGRQLEAMVTRGCAASQAVPGRVDLWELVLDASPEVARGSEAWLSAEEHDRSARFASPAQRMEYNVTHALLRSVLGAYDGRPPQCLRFTAGAHGKPRLLGSNGRPSPIEFNLSHSAGRAMVAVSIGAELGLDLERETTQVDPWDLARRFFHPAEASVIEAAPSSRQAALFLRYWVSKEAVLKAAGSGLQGTLDSFRMEFGEDGRRAAAVFDDGSAGPETWTVKLPSVAPGWHVAVCVRGSNWAIRPAAAVKLGRQVEHRDD